MVDPNVQLVLHNKVEELRSILLKLLSRVDIIEECRSQNLNVLGC